MIIKNYTPHDVGLIFGADAHLDARSRHWIINDAYSAQKITLKSEGCARVKSAEREVSRVDVNGHQFVVYELSFGEIENLPEPDAKTGTQYIVSALVLQAAKKAGRHDCLAVTHLAYAPDGKMLGALALSA